MSVKKHFVLYAVIFLFFNILGFSLAGQAEGKDQSFAFEQGEEISSIAVVKDAAYLLTRSGLYQWSISADKTKFLSADIASSGEYVKQHTTQAVDPITGDDVTVTTSGYMDYTDSLQHLIAEEGRLLALNSYTGTLFEVVKSWGKWKKIEVVALPWEDMVEGEGETSYAKPITSIIKEKDWLYVLSDQGSDQKLLGFNVFTGAKKEILARHTKWISSYKQGQLLVLRYDQDLAFQTSDGVIDVAALDPTSGNVTTLFTINAYINEVQGLCYDQSLDRVLLTFGGQVMSWQEHIGLKPAAYLTANSGNLYWSGVMEGKNIYVLATEREFFTRDVDPLIALPQALVIEDHYFNPEEVRAFEQAYPNTPLFFKKSTPGVMPGQKIMMKDDTVDIFVLHNTSDSIDSLKAKDYLYSLDQSERLANAVEGMYPQITKALHHQGQLVAFPKEIQVHALRCDLQLFNELGITPPLTWADMVHLYADWGKTYQEIYPDYALTSFSHRFGSLYGLTYMAIQSYMEDQMLKEENIHFDTQEFMNMITLINQRREDINAIEDRLSLGGDNYLITQEEIIKNPGFSSLTSNLHSSYFIPQFIPGEEAMVNGDLSVYVINPYSTNKETALLFLETLAQNIFAEKRIRFYKGEHQPIYGEGMEENIDFYEQRIAEHKNNLEKAEPAERAQIEERIAVDQKQLEQFQNDPMAWRVSPEDIKSYQGLENKWGIIEHPLIGNNTDGFESIIQAFSTNTITPEELVYRLNEKVQMMEGEKQ